VQQAQIVTLTNPERHSIFNPAPKRAAEVSLVDTRCLCDLLLAMRAVCEIEGAQLLSARPDDLAHTVFRNRRASDNLNKALQKLLEALACHSFVSESRATVWAKRILNISRTSSRNGGFQSHKTRASRLQSLA
jgi:hypothetical protein